MKKLLTALCLMPCLVMAVIQYDYVQPNTTDVALLDYEFRTNVAVYPLGLYIGLSRSTEGYISVYSTNSFDATQLTQMTNTILNHDSTVNRPDEIPYPEELVSVVSSNTQELRTQILRGITTIFGKSVTPMIIAPDSDLTIANVGNDQVFSSDSFTFQGGQISGDGGGITNISDIGVLSSDLIVTNADLYVYGQNKTMAMGEIYISEDFSAVTPLTQNVYTVVQGTGRVGSVSMWTDISATNNALVFTNSVPLMCHMGATISLSSAGGNDQVKVAAFLNDTIIEPSIVQFKVGTGGDVHSTALHFMKGNVATNDQVTIKIMNQTDGDDLTVNEMNIFGMCM